MLIIVQHEAAATLTAVAPEGVHTFMLAASVFFGALVYICGDGDINFAGCRTYNINNLEHYLLLSTDTEAFCVTQGEEAAE